VTADLYATIFSGLATHFEHLATLHGRGYASEHHCGQAGSNSNPKVTANRETTWTMTTLSPNLDGRDGTFYDDHSIGEDDAKRLGSNMSEQLPIQGATGPAGEPGLPPSRPSSSSIVANPQRSSIGPPRRPPTATRGSWNDSTRPNTSSSRNYVSNLTSAAFFRPSSSRKMREEAQQQVSSPLAQDPEPTTPRKSTETSRSRRHRHRYSNASVVTIEGTPRPLVDADAPPVPPSSHGEDPRNRALRGQESSTPLRGQEPLNIDVRTPSGLKPDKSPLTPRSFRHSLGALSSRNGERKPNGHRRLDSGPPTPMVEKEQAVSYDPPSDLGRNYEYYNGNAVFLLKGRLLNARQRPLNAVTGFLAVLPAALFFAFSAPFLWHHVSPAIPILFAYVFWVCISAYAHASFSDPGILPRNLHPHPPTSADADPLAVGPSTSDWVTVRSFGPAATGSTNTAMEVPTKYCKSCNIWRPPRAHHCRICDACIETQDHHCVWLNNCVGRRNYRQFFTFVATGTILALFLLAASLAHILVWMNQNNSSFGGAISHDWSLMGAMAMFIYSILVFPYPAALCGYHVFLMARGESTREYLNSHKFLPKDRHRPFSQNNVFRNFITILGRPEPPTYMRFKSTYHEGDQRMGAEQKRSRKNRHGQSDDLEKGALEMKEMNGQNHAGFEAPKSRLPLNNSSRAGVRSPSDKA